MAAELACILLALGLMLIGGIWWWGARQSAQAPGNSQLREITPSIEPPRAEVPGDVHVDRAPELSNRDWGVPPLEPLSIRTSEFESVPPMEGPMLVDADPAPRSASVASEHADTEVAAERTAPAGQAPNVAEKQKIVTVRVCAKADERWPGATLLAALESNGLAYGRYQVFHRKHVDGRSLFCVASLIEPGIFDVARMPSEEFRGVSMFAVLPGPLEPLLTVDELLTAARGLAQELAGQVQDAKGMPLSPHRAAAVRDEVARFQASLPRT